MLVTRAAATEATVATDTVAQLQTLSTSFVGRRRFVVAVVLLLLFLDHIHFFPSYSHIEMLFSIGEAAESIRDNRFCALVRVHVCVCVACVSRVNDCGE